MLDVTNFTLNAEIIAQEVQEIAAFDSHIGLQRLNNTVSNATVNQVVNPKVLGYNIMWEKLQQRNFERSELVKIFSKVALQPYVGHLVKSDYCRHLGEYFQRLIGNTRYEYSFLKEKQTEKNGRIKEVFTNTCIFVIYKLAIENEKSTKLQVYCKLSLTFGEDSEIDFSGNEYKIYYPLYLEVIEGQKVDCNEILDIISRHDSEDLMQIFRDICNDYGYKYNTHAGVYFLPTPAAKLLMDVADDILKLGLEIRYLTVVGATQDDYKFLSKIFASDIIEELECVQIELAGFYFHEKGKAEKLASIMKSLQENNFNDYLSTVASQNPLLAHITNRVKKLINLPNDQRLGDKQLQRMVKKILEPAKVRRIESLQEQVENSLKKLQDSLPKELLERVESFTLSRKTAYEHVNLLVSEHLQSKLAAKIAKHQ